MITLQAAPDELFFTWQYQVQAANFKEYDLDRDMVILVGLQNGKQPSNHIKEFEKTFRGKIYYYYDTRKSKSYLSSIRPNLIKQFLKDHPTNAFTFIDQDIIWLRHPHLERFESDPNIYTAEQAKGYTYAQYMKVFNGGDIFRGLCKIVGVTPEEVEAQDAVCGGAQYIIKGTDYLWWDEYEDQLEEAYKFIGGEVEKDRKEHNDPKRYNIQHWGTDLYVIWMKLVKLGRPLLHLKEIDFTWPYDTFENAEEKGTFIMHNAGISEHNRDEGYFDKGLYKGQTPFNEDFSYVKPGILQQKYISYFKEFSTKNVVTSPKIEPMIKRKMLVLWNSSYGRKARKIHIDLVNASLQTLKKAADNTKEVDVKVVTTTWEPIPNNPFEQIISPFRDLGHLNYLLQLKQQVVNNPGYDFVVIIEHDCLTPPDYFNEIYRNWDYSKYGLNNRNYIGINKTGYLDVNPQQHHHPMSMMSFAYFWFDELLNKKIGECLTNISPTAPHGWVCVEPDDKGMMSEFNSKVPNIHVSTEGLGEWEHHFTIHNEVCYERQSNGKVYRNDWGNYLELVPFLKNYQPQHAQEV